MQALIYSHTFAAFKEWCKHYNEGKETREQLRGNVQATYMQLLKSWSSQINQIGHMAPLSTNSVSLGKSLSVSARTVRRHIQRLKAAGLIDTIFHGSRANYDVVFIKTDFLQFGVKLDLAELEKEMQQLAAAAGATSLQADKMATHWIPGNINKENTDVHCAFAQSELIDHVPGTIDLETTKTMQTGCVELQGVAANDNKGHQAGQTVGAIFRAPAELADIWSYVLSLWKYALIHVFFRLNFLVDGEKTAGLSYFYTEMISVPRSQRLQRYAELQTRLSIVAAWLKKHPEKYVQIPSRYFDRENPNGFERTRQWLAAQKALAGTIEAEKQKMASIRLLRQELKNYTTGQRTFVQCRNRLAKIHPELSALFSEEVTSILFSNNQNLNL